MDTLALTLVIVGAINWGGLIGLFQFDLVAAIFGSSSSVLSRIIYGLVGLAGIYSFKFYTDREKNFIRFKFIKEIDSFKSYLFLRKTLIIKILLEK